ncbi:unnamed protein product [Peronospora belbahrii]|uniref:Uncharacterized protein n=1 Tax=Peronospora belbahrii TaxID=622444 RepID=A0AAU9KWT7_9STRA|nr:unnamed protein product [Peronospora belbahrii]
MSGTTTDYGRVPMFQNTLTSQRRFPALSTSDGGLSRLNLKDSDQLLVEQLQEVGLRMTLTDYDLSQPRNPAEAAESLAEATTYAIFNDGLGVHATNPGHQGEPCKTLTN